MNYKKSVAALCCILLLAGCNNAGSDAESTTEEWRELSIVSAATECGALYKEFLKLGAQTTEEITAEHSEWIPGSNDSYEWWEYEDAENKISYRRDLDNGISNYTLAFDVHTYNIEEWLSQERSGFDVLLGLGRKDDVIEGDHWYYTWEGPFEDVQLRVLATTETNTYIAILSMNRQGETTVDENTFEVAVQ